jgi:molybdopterin/thiamine biosynthesis adenylyltransferase
MNDQQLLRYARHVMLEEIGIEGQQRLLDASALLIGAGGLGSPVAMYLGSAGVGRLTVIDDDAVDLSNLQRQIAHDTSRIGQPKAESVAARVRSLNPDVQVRAVQHRADTALLDEFVPLADVVLDCTDNFRTRHAVNAACVRHRKPLVSGAAIGWDAQLAVYDTRHPSGPCYACIFPSDAKYEDVACSTMGVLAPLVGIIGSLQAAEAIKLLTASPGPGAGLIGRLLMLDARSLRFDEIGVARRIGCEVCGSRLA